MLSRLGRFLRGRFTRDLGQTSGEDRAAQDRGAGDRATTEPPQPAEALQAADPFAQQVLRRVRPLSVSRAPRQQRGSLAVSTTRPLAQAAPPRVRSDAPSAALPLAAPARPVPAVEEEEPATQPAADTQFFEGSTGDVRWDALWTMRGTRRSASEEPAPPGGDAPGRSASPGQPVPRRPAPGAGPSSPPVQRAPSTRELDIAEQRPPGPIPAGPEAEEIAAEAAELDRPGYPERESTGAEVGRPTAPETGMTEDVAAPRTPGPARSPAPIQRETDRPSGGETPPPPAPRATPAPAVQRSQAPAARPIEETVGRQQRPADAEAQADDTAGRAADVRPMGVRPADVRPADVRPADVHRPGTGPVARRERIVPRSRLEELPTQAPRAQSEPPVQHAPAAQEARAQQDVSQADVRRSRQVPVPTPPRPRQPSPPAPVQRAPEGTAEEPVEEGRGSQPPAEPGAEPVTTTPRHETGHPPSLPARSGPVQRAAGPEAGPEPGPHQAREETAQDVAAPGAASTEQSIGRSTHGDVSPEQAPAPSPPVQRTSVEQEIERARPAPSSTDRTSLSGEPGDRAFDEHAPEERLPDQRPRGEPPRDERAFSEPVRDQHVRPEPQAVQGSQFAPTQPVRETAQPPAGVSPARPVSVETPSPVPDTAPARAPDHAEPAPPPETSPRSGPVQLARGGRTPTGEAAQASTEGTAHAQVDATTAAQNALPAVEDGAAGGEGVDRRALLRQALQPRIVPTVVQAAPEDSASADSATATQQASAPAGPAGEAAEPDIESLARDVYRILRRRLLVEHERELGRR